MKKILLLGGSAQQIVAIHAAQKRGLYTVLCDYLPDNPGQYEADRFYLVSTTDKDAVLDVAKKEAVDGVLAFASDPAAPTAAYVAKQMHLSGNPLSSVEILCNKDRFRRFLHENGFHAPTAFDFTNEASALAAKDTMPYPVIVKPVDSSGSKGATVLKTADGWADAVSFAFSFSRSHRIIAETFIEKNHPYLIGGDVLVLNGKIELWGLLNCHRDANVNPLVPVGKSYPLALAEEDEKKVKTTLQTLVTKLGIRDCAMNVELVVDKLHRVWPIDIGPRSGGNMIPDFLGDLFGVDIADLCVRSAMGEKISLSLRTPQGCYATHNLHSAKDGAYRDIVFAPELEKHIYRKCLYKSEGDRVEYFDNASKCLGILFLKFDDGEQMEHILSRITELYEVRLKD
ncbi:MAG: ATP-grasp domain-containing protein [Oscillospiraceae bacterium]|nr:ATP-grasp domain-containing protein [Oscillospiraceae bacterium]